MRFLCSKICLCKDLILSTLLSTDNVLSQICDFMNGYDLHLTSNMISPNSSQVTYYACDLVPLPQSWLPNQ